MPDAPPAFDCPHFGTCGGCSTLTTPIAAQRADRLARVADRLRPYLAGCELSFTDPAEPPPRHDRVRILYPAQPGPAGPILGLYRRGTHQLVELRSCELQHPLLTALGARAAELCRRHGLHAYDEHRHTGCLRALSARLAPSTGELLLGLVTRTAALPAADRLAAALVEAADGLAAGYGARTVGLVHNVNPAPGNALLGSDAAVLYGRDHLFDHVDDLWFRVGFQSFYQLHARADRLLYRPALAMVGDLAGRTVVDGFGGVGTFALRAARAGARTTLAEIHPTACADARANATRNDLPVTIVEAPFAEAVLPPDPDLLIVDPTRAGLQAAGRAQLRRLAAPRVLYVACGLRALARDLAELPEYAVEQVRLADLFPHTEHVEVLALLQRR